MQGKMKVDIFAEEFMLLDINDVIQLLFVPAQSRLTPGLISLHHQLISSTSLSRDTFVKKILSIQLKISGQEKG